MGLREVLVSFVRFIVNLVHVPHTLSFRWESRAAPDKLKVELPLLVSKALHHPPETLNTLVLKGAALNMFISQIIISYRVLSDFLELINVNDFISACAGLNFFPSEQPELINGNHEADSLFDGFQLVCALCEADLLYQPYVLVEVGLGHCHSLAALHELHL